MPATKRQYSLLDQLLIHSEQALNTLSGQAPRATRPSPATCIANSKPLTEAEKKHASGLMRVNHCGEVCAQALYQGQALTARDPAIKQKLEHAAQEEQDHLAWCSERVEQLGGHTSWLNPIWYVGSLSLGVVAGLFGDRWSLGFLAETETQVVKHLESHQTRLPKNDDASRAVVEQMKQDEAEHAVLANDNGAAELPVLIKTAMRASSKIMTSLAYWI